MRYLQNTISVVDSNRQFSGFSPLAPLVSPRWNNQSSFKAAISHAARNKSLAVSGNGIPTGTAAVSFANVTFAFWMLEFTAVTISFAFAEFVAFAVCISSLTHSACI
ncbi:hypothetical protein OIU79_000697 [Salix purpurea]|uniref:Uncharacterized protein n=1 Tax=Salix purpurea TaxID=77065 RepID=A0A9Q0V3Q5_SALPP|nr:hypothetical protein OIU79_000697 [Salix purpurea]